MKGNFCKGNKNYYLSNNQAYTRNNVLVYNLYIRKISRSISPEDLQEYFSGFGKVNQVYLLMENNTGRSTARQAFIYFQEPFGAATALQASYHAIDGRRFKVKAAGSWRQPVSFATNTDTVQDAVSGTDPDVQPKRIGVQLLDLNDDCLQLICQLLELRDQVSLARSCNRCASIFALCARVEQKVFTLDRIRGMKRSEQYVFFSLSGPHIETISGNLSMPYQERIVNCLSKFCCNTKRLSLVSYCLKHTLLDRLCTKLLALTELVLEGGEFNDDAILSMRRLPNLRKLAIISNHHLTGKHLNKLTTVQDMHLQNCGNVQSHYITEMVDALVDLQTLNLQQCFFRSEVYRSMTKHALKLETLTVPMNITDWESVATIPNLRSLEINGLNARWPANAVLFDKLAQHKSDKLEHLKIVAKNTINHSNAAKISRLKRLKVLVCNSNQQLDDECLRCLSELESLQELDIVKSPLITNDGLLYLLKNCQQLNCVNITFCAKIDDNFVHKAIKLLPMTREEHSMPVTFLVGGTAISEFMLQNAEYRQAVDNNIIILSFHQTGTMADNNDE